MDAREEKGGHEDPETPQMTTTGRHIVLLGDSIFDNKTYTNGEPDVVTHLRGLLPPGDRATLCAVDGSVTHSLAAQVSTIPRDATHLVVSIGGNDAMGNLSMLEMPVTSTAEALRLFGEQVAAFENDYRSAIRPLLQTGLEVAVCTIYNGAFEAFDQPDFGHRARVALMMFNDVILRVAFEHHVSAIDLRLVCTEATDFANPIEPSGPGGLQIAKAIARATGVSRADTCTIVCC